MAGGEAPAARSLLCAQCFAPISSGRDVRTERLPENAACVYAYNLDLSLGAADFFCGRARCRWRACHARRRARARAPAAAEATGAAPEVWFHGYTHTRARCRACKAHVGWLFDPVVPVQSATYAGLFPPGLEPPAKPFVGLIVTKLKPHDADVTLSAEIDAYVCAPGHESLANDLAIPAELRLELTMEDARHDIGNKNERSLVGALLIGQLQRAMSEPPDGAPGVEALTAEERKSKDAMDALRKFTIGMANKLADHDDENDGDD
ncbi:hypothetical protein KFE25_011506 [Diacronema lutheri]|uniref:CULT domain-containing protein n=2 Tax=Diacronema lutheri TaxID=2081491 RepID=A0A8J5X6D2_DIALT|nr:hypothetical protein KFE25_011506 [Diacronema lutheri]